MAVLLAAGACVTLMIIVSLTTNSAQTMQIGITIPSARTTLLPSRSPASASFGCRRVPARARVTHAATMIAVTSRRPPKAMPIIHQKSFAMSAAA